MNLTFTQKKSFSGKTGNKKSDEYVPVFVPSNAACHALARSWGFLPVLVFFLLGPDAVEPTDIFSEFENFLEI